MFAINDTSELQYVAFITKTMLESITTYPEVLVLDVTYQTNVNNMALLNVMCIDNNGQGRPVLHAFMQNECALYIESCLQFLEARY